MLTLSENILQSKVKTLRGTFSLWLSYICCIVEQWCSINPWCWQLLIIAIRLRMMLANFYTLVIAATL
jgi:hypothetical protein